MKLTVTVTGLREVQSALRGFSDRRLAASAATALSRVAAEARDAVKGALPSIFDRPNAYTLGAIGMKPATAQTLQSEVFVKSGRIEEYLRPEIFGGTRLTKAFEKLLQRAGHLPAGWRAVPGPGVTLDQYGNISRAQLRQILGGLGVAVGKAKPAATGKRGKTRAKVERLFAVPPGTKGLKPGIYKRGAGREVTAVLRFVPNASYTRRLDFAGIVIRTVQQRLRPQIERAIRESAERLFARATP